jgi:hypothetical protein
MAHKREIMHENRSRNVQSPSDRIITYVTFQCTDMHVRICLHSSLVAIKSQRSMHLSSQYVTGFYQFLNHKRIKVIKSTEFSNVNVKYVIFNALLNAEFGECVQHLYFGNNSLFSLRGSSFESGPGDRRQRLKLFCHTPPPPPRINTAHMTDTKFREPLTPTEGSTIQHEHGICTAF